MTQVKFEPNAVRSLTLERLPVVMARTGLSRSSIYRQIASGTFPPPVKLGERISAWEAAAVDQWILARLGAKQAGVAL